MADNRTRRRKRRRQPTYEFKPDPTGTNPFKRLYMTKLQRRKILKWSLYTLVCLVLLIIQDVMLSRFRLFGATTDLTAAIILLIGIYEGLEAGGTFVLIASTVYWFSGSAPGPYVILLLSYLTIGASYFRQSFWNRSYGSITLCTCVALILYEMILLCVGIFLGLTIWARTGVFFLTGVYTCLAMLPMYPLVNAIAKIGGDTWKE